MVLLGCQIVSNNFRLSSIFVPVAENMFTGFEAVLPVIAFKPSVISGDFSSSSP